MDGHSPTHALSQGLLCAGYDLLNSISWSCNLPAPPVFVLLIFWN